MNPVKKTVQKLLELYKKLKSDSLTTDRSELIELPKEIHDDMENTLSISLKQNLKRFAKDTLQYHGAIHKGAERIRTTTKATIEIYQNLGYLIETGGSPEEVHATMEKARRLAIYTYAMGKGLDGDTKDIADKAIHLPDAIRYLNENEEAEGKDLAYSPETLERIQEARYEDAILQKATDSPCAYNQNCGQYPGRGGRGQRTYQGRGYTHNTNNHGGLFWERTTKRTRSTNDVSNKSTSSQQFSPSSLELLKHPSLTIEKISKTIQLKNGSLLSDNTMKKSLENKKKRQYSTLQYPCRLDCTCEQTPKVPPQLNNTHESPMAVLHYQPRVPNTIPIPTNSLEDQQAFQTLRDRPASSEQECRKMLRIQFRDSSSKVYDQVWNKFSEWCQKMDPTLNIEDYNPTLMVEYLVLNRH
ncbi:hypothetical protein PHYBLDRAFT_174850 [Phycomyces blakesleeanus NRRL 1555(-)]|uniref:Uncharacterized protein n=1 Tax=Phycomyces blakesleeanus (strain ATCC 8743b / DSM 1359 / FGSC 10004 / NBRC 33097 / NRRL 1555) TaxID=763407 RepID=A0A167JWQ4_PHYB8|nr:hypothetical protein PHYBLDRAFT_174850 [Phycomyces blakesleeanus NRRL 1555(-)]OAD66826.1 hypothetical protein PHYBLDRAFT_174850 [Phycomyces blakesleeanus NRRL 1555(-)]|eukprot:XP_018284866.1 hypothetical protein PHYBLDRAFT_174850 [Phycomyces blakesleeanus NRRL 1555(-)]